jgi:hypothetical protein
VTGLVVVGDTLLDVDLVHAADACGAGDRFAVTAACGLMRGASADEAVHAAVHAAAQFLARGGVAALGRAMPIGTPEDTGVASALSVIADRDDGGVPDAGRVFRPATEVLVPSARAARRMASRLVLASCG